MFTKTIRFLFIAALTIVRGFGAQPDVPVVSLEYTPLFDTTYARMASKPLDEACQAELRERLPEFRAAWEREGPLLLQTAAEQVKIPFRFHETRAALVVARFPSLSHPLILNAHEYLRSANAPNTPQPMEVFVDTVFHEVLHRYIDNVLGGYDAAVSTPLLQKYAQENLVVRNHLHLYALQTVVYGQLHKREQLVAVIASEQKLMRAVDFARARKIVADETPAAFLSELQHGNASVGAAK